MGKADGAKDSGAGGYLSSLEEGSALAILPSLGYITCLAAGNFCSSAVLPEKVFLTVSLARRSYSSCQSPRHCYGHWQGSDYWETLQIALGKRKGREAGTWKV